METRKVLIMVGLLAIAGGLAWILNRGYGKVSPRGYEIATSLLSICNRRDTYRLATIEKLTRESLVAGTLQPREARWFGSIIGKAKSGRWERAAADVRQLMDDQVRPVNQLPKLD